MALHLPTEYKGISVVMSAKGLERFKRSCVRVAAEVARQLEREGGYIFFCDSAGTTLFHEKVGELSEEKRAKYEEFSKEKAMRLLDHPEHVSSWQSRDPDTMKFGGAIKIDGSFILSFSGFPELHDEAYCLAMAQVWELINPIDHGDIDVASGGTGLYIEIRGVIGAMAVP